MSKLGQKREREGPNNQPLVVGKKEKIRANLPHALDLHAAPSPLFFTHASSSFWHLKLIHIRLVTTPYDPLFK